MATQNRFNDGLTCYSGYVVNDVMQLDIHLIQGRLRMLDILACHGQQVLPEPINATGCANGLSGTKRAQQQSQTLKMLQPLTIAGAALATVHILDMPCID